MAAKKAQKIALPAIVDLDALDTFRDGLIDALERGPVSVDAKGVERVATNALLMMLSAAETARRNNFEFEVADASEAIRSSIERLGLSASFAPIMKG